MDVQTTGRKIAQLRKEKALTQKDIAEQLHVSVAAVSKWERGLNYPDLSLLEPLAEVLGITAAELLGLENHPVEQVIREVTEVSVQTRNAAARDRLKSICLLAGALAVLLVLTGLVVLAVGTDAFMRRLYAVGCFNVLALLLGFSSWGTAAAGCFVQRKERWTACMAVSLALCALALYMPTLITDLTMRFVGCGTVEDTIAGYDFASVVLLLGTAVFGIAGWIARRSRR